MAEDLDDELLEPEVAMEVGFNKVVVVDGVPVVPDEKYDKLKSVIHKIFSTAGTVEELYLPKDASGQTKGYAFVEFTTAEAAEAAVEKLKDYPLDKKHIFTVSQYDDFDRVINVPDRYVAPTVQPYQTRENLRDWLLNQEELDECAIRYADQTEVLTARFGPGEEPRSIVKRKDWTESYVAWSPLGSYLACILGRGVVLWGGPKWERLMRFPHQGVMLLDFSPKENYLVTASPQFQENDNPRDPQCIIVWDVRTGAKLRGFLGSANTAWPVFKWSYDDKYLARLQSDPETAISVYETPSMNLLDKKSIKVEGVKDFQWSPSENVLSYFVPESNNKPASVILLEIPSRKEKRQKNLFSVSDCKMYWQSSGDYLLVKVDRFTKTKKSTYTYFEIFRMRERDIPIEQLEFKEGCSIIALAWEPQGARFAVISSEGQPGRADVSFYQMEKQVKLLKTLEKKAANTLMWAPNQNGFIVLAGLLQMNGVLEFYNVNELETMGVDEHFSCTAIDWDPSGRYVSTVVSHWRHQVENGYRIYSFQGKLLKSVLKDKFFQLVWRPRPPSLLPEEKLKSIKKNILDWKKKFMEEDEQKKKALESQQKEKKETQRKEFLSLLERRHKDYVSDSDIRKKLRNGADSDDENDYIEREEWVEELEEIKEIPVA